MIMIKPPIARPIRNILTENGTGRIKPNKAAPKINVAWLHFT